MEEILEEFLIESYENIDSVDRELVALEADPDSEDLLANIFRNLHTVKGTSGFFALSNLERVAHAAENMLSELRTGRLSLTSEIMDELLGAVDAIREMLAVIEADGNDGSNSYTKLVESLHLLTSGKAEEPDGAEGPDNAEEPAGAEGDDEAEVVADTEPAAEGAETSNVPEVENAAADAADGAESADAVPEPEAEPAATGPADKPRSSTPHHAADSTIRVDVGLLDRLMNLVGELVLARNQVLQYQMSVGDSSFQPTSQQLDLITTELQEGVMKTRMQPMGNVWSKLPRVVRDLSAACDKKVRLEMEGEDTELDKTLLEAITDPLTHIVRNAIDHGIEDPERRLAVGKDETGVLRLRALHEGGLVVIEISDDGAGLDLERIRQKAVTNGLATAERINQLSDRDVGMLIFEPGFSTAQAVTNVSGRGVGMDVVKTNVEKIGGTLDLQSEPGMGMTLTLRIPLTLAIIPALILSCDGDRYLIPQINLVEVLHIIEGASEARVETVGDASVLRLRGELLPVVSLREVIGAGAPAGDGEESEDDGLSIVVLQADGFQFALAVDAINDTEEIVVKPLGPHLKQLEAFAGTTIMGDGAVSLILDVMGLAQLGGVARATDVRSTGPRGEVEERERRDPTQMVLVCTVGAHRIGVPLGLISRLEEVDASSVELAGGSEVIQYGERLLHLVRVGDAVGAMPASEHSDQFPILVYESEQGLFGFAVDEIVDVFEADLSSAESSVADGIALSGVIGRRVTDLLDIEALIASARPTLVHGGAA